MPLGLRPNDKIMLDQVKRLPYCHNVITGDWKCYIISEIFVYYFDYEIFVILFDYFSKKPLISF